METIKGDAHNLSSPVVGLLQKKKSLLRRSDESNVFILKKADKGAYISNGPMSEDIKKKNLPYIENIPLQKISLLKEGDIVLATPEGQLNIIYDSASRHNCIFATNRCNLKCIMCPQPPSSEPDPLIDTQIAAIKLMALHKPEYLAITGGEPTLLGSGLLELIAACKKYIPTTGLVILTNGKNLKKFSFVKEIVELQHPNIQFAVPLYSDDYSIHDKIVGIEGSFFDTIKGLHNLALFGQRIEIRTVVLPQNASRLVNLAEFIYKNLTFVGHIAFMGIEITGMARKNSDILWQDPVIYADDLEKAFRYLQRVDMIASIYNFQLCILPEKLWPFCRKSISDWKNGYVEECSKCAKISDCGGFFTTSGEYRSKQIKSIK
jgi:His-Xaa-Ser system radical SAM maturase HxsC